LDAEVQDAGSFGDHLADRGQDQRGGGGEHRREQRQVSDRHGVSPTFPAALRRQEILYRRSTSTLITASISSEETISPICGGSCSTNDAFCAPTVMSPSSSATSTTPPAVSAP